MSWALRRKILYGGAVIIVALVILIWFGVIAFSHPPTCFDNTQNQGETGIDCGGPCARLCPNEAREPQVEWSRAFGVSTSTYTAVAYLKNLNAGAGAYGVRYAFQFFDSNNSLIAERDGAIDIPPQQTVPVVETHVDLGARIPAHTFLVFLDTIVWQLIPNTALPAVRITNEQLNAGAGRLTATVVNDGTGDVQNLTLDAIVFDAQDNAVAASQSVIDLISAGASQTLVFTWPTGFPSAVRSEITPLPALTSP